jgi:hypothetical protein
MTAPINSGINSWGRVARVAEAGVLLAFSRLDDRRRSVVAHVSNPGASLVYSGTFRDRGDEHGGLHIRMSLRSVKDDDGFRYAAAFDSGPSLNCGSFCVVDGTLRHINYSCSIRLNIETRGQI